jgi:hypothetical protein
LDGSYGLALAFLFLVNKNKTTALYSYLYLIQKKATGEPREATGEAQGKLSVEGSLRRVSQN